MLSRRGHRLSRFRKNKRRLRERLRQRIFFRDKVVPEAMEKPRVLVLTGAGISAESGIRTFRAADGLWEEHRVEDVATRKVSIAILNWCKRFITPVVDSCSSQKFSLTPRILRWLNCKTPSAIAFCW